MKDQSSKQRSFSISQIVTGVVLLLLIGLGVGWGITTYQHNQRLIKTDTEPAAQLKRDDSGKPLKPVLFIASKVTEYSPESDATEQEGFFDIELSIDKEKCLEYYGSDGASQCRLNWDLLDPARAQWKVDPPIPDATWKFTPLAGKYRARYSFAHENLQSGKKYTITLPQELGENVKARSKKETLLTSPFIPTIEDWAFRVNPENPKEQLLTGKITFGWAANPESIERNTHISLIPQDEKQTPKEGENATSLKWNTPTFTHHTNGRVVGITAKVTGLPAKSEVLRLTLSPGIQRFHGETVAKEGSQHATTIPGQDIFVSLEDATSTIATDDNNQSHQVLILHFTRPVNVREVQATTTATLLPLQKKESIKTQYPTVWVDYAPDSSVILDTLAASSHRQLPLTPEPSVEEYSQSVSFKYTVPKEYLQGDAPSGDFFHIANTGGATSTTDYTLAPFAKILQVAPFYRQLSIMQKGGILSLNASKTLAVFSRGLTKVDLKAWQVRPEFISLLATQSSGDLDELTIDRYKMDFSYLAEQQHLQYVPQHTDGATPDYHALDLSPLLGGEGKGLFRLELRGTHRTGQNGAEYTQSYQTRFLLVTDLAMNVKEDRDGKRHVFVNSFSTGTPCKDVVISVLGRNGLPVFSKETDEKGHVIIPNVNGFKHEKEAVAILASLNDDYTFLPLNAYKRRVSYDKFPSAAGRHALKDGLDTYVFSERDIFRPGEELRFGALITNTEWDNAKLQGLPLKVKLHNPRGTLVYEKKHTLDASGLMSITIPTKEADPTGMYRLSLALDTLWIGSASVHVEEFQPETLKVDSSFTTVLKKNFEGWVLPEDLSLKVSVNNLYGTPAADNEVRFSFRLTPTPMHFQKFAQYKFYDPMAKGRVYAGNTQTAHTNEKGEVDFPIDLSSYAAGCYLLHTTAEAFEAGGGKSVTALNSILVSPQNTLVGWQSDANTSYLPKGTETTVNFIAVDNTLEQVSLDNLKLTINEIQYVSSLVKSNSGDYKYEDLRRATKAHSQSIDIGAKGVAYSLPTDATGYFELILTDEEGLERCKFTYNVSGAGQRVYGLERDANLRINLDKTSYQTDDEIEIFVSAPYAGTGLITLESDTVLASQWFTATTSDSVQRIHVPAEAEGRVFVNVAVVRDIYSDATLATPFAYAVAPFWANIERRNQGLQLDVPSKVLPGETLPIKIQADKPGKAIVFAVDEGILQLTNYTTPSAIAYFLKNNSLGVGTIQNWDLIMPEFYQMHASFGGDFALLAPHTQDDANPFRRRAEDSVAYWSGLIDVDSEGTTLEYTVPSYFNGSLRVMAVSAGGNTIGDTATATTVRGPLVITPDLPVAVAPGDEFEVTIAIANNVENSGENLEVHLDVALDDGLGFIRYPESSIHIDEHKQGRATFRLKATDALGESTVSLVASTTFNDEKIIVKRPINLSVRPASPKVATFKAGFIKGSQQTIPVGRTLYPHFAEINASVSGLPLPIMDGLIGFLTTFPHGCTEQILSASFPYIIMNASPDLMPIPQGSSVAEIQERSDEAFQRALATLRERESTPGRFSLWPHESSQGYSFLTVYSLDYLISAQAAGLEVPEYMVRSAQREILRIIQSPPRHDDALRLNAYAAWVYTRSGKTLTELHQLVKDFDAYSKDWRSSPSAALIAACYKMMHQDKEALELIKTAKTIDPSSPKKDRYMAWFYSPLWDNSLFLSAVAGSFPDQLESREAKKALVHIINDTAGGQYTTSSAAQGVRALAEYARSHMEQFPDLHLEARDKNGTLISVEPIGTLVKRLYQNNEAHDFRFSGGKGLYWQVSSDGFDKEPLPSTAQKLFVTAEYIPVDGQPLSKLAQGDDVYVLIRGHSQSPIDNVAITSLIPGGFEMVMSKAGNLIGSEETFAEFASYGESDAYSEHDEYNDSDADERYFHENSATGATVAHPNLGQIAAVQSMLGEADIQGRAMPIVHTERREDRMVVFTSLSQKESLFIYRIKAINKGRFTLPALSATALYDPDARANTKTATIDVQ